ncbi:hypothetical protein SK066_14740 [Paenibacillus hunanensis]|uniref:hypothetical protein n=1 Tax=Paenibacillus hunanensis TaxID=539262 RepID=UPI002A6AC0BA|nr:hypothetical protein [Paenibacillus hunanensis]WPP39873.1 hypothetical protein SK066_14740 [Paenibacillus hunanensis]
MDQDTKLAFGQILGQIYRIQKNISPDICQVNDATIYALLNGVETTIDSQLLEQGFISREKEAHVSNVLAEYHNDSDKLNNLKGYYDIEHDLEAGNINRVEASIIMTMFNERGLFKEVIAKMDSSFSPVECKRFEISEYDI